MCAGCQCHQTEQEANTHLEAKECVCGIRERACACGHDGELHEEAPHQSTS